MTNRLTFNSVLVPIDFSSASSEVFDQTLALLTGDNPVIILLHVVDSSLIESAVAHEFGTQEEVMRRMRESAERNLAEYRQRAEGKAEVDALVSVGVPFVEILKKAKDFDVDVIVMGKVGSSGPFEKLLFGSTAEKVLRGSPRPVLILPYAPEE